MGLSLAREINMRFPDASIAVIDKESDVGLHASGRNSGVLHSGIYYKEGSLKARLCVEGAKLMAQFCREENIDIKPYGKVIVPTNKNDDQILEIIKNRAQKNGAVVEIVDKQQLKEIEPATYSVTERALYSPNTSVIPPKDVLLKIKQQLDINKINIFLNNKFIDNKSKNIAKTNTHTIKYGHLINVSGLYADKVAKKFNVGSNYTMLPFKGIYYDLIENSGIHINGLIYPVPDMNTPFLGVHFTKDINNKIFAGPTAVPVLSRENYRGTKGLRIEEMGGIVYNLIRQYFYNKQGFRKSAHSESIKMLKSRFSVDARKLIPKLRNEHLQLSKKVGIRAQLLDKKNKLLVTDFIVEKGQNSTHVLNAVSPAFTSAFSFSKYIVDEYIIK